MGSGRMNAVEALRAIMTHQDPDIVLLEEIADPDIALEAIETALTGHLVIASIRGKGGVSAVRQMLDYGVDIEALSETLIGISSQRLARKLCQKCKTPAEADPSLLEKLGLPQDAPTFRSSGCSACEGRGWKGRVVLFSLFDFTDDRLARFPADGSRDELLKSVSESEVRTLRQSAAEAVGAGLTTPEEALRVIG
jgi:type II secretory ATPase GspE/PulE/Tfp pilus assembly ATPase PilB-like protein